MLKEGRKPNQITIYNLFSIQLINLFYSNDNITFQLSHVKHRQRVLTSSRSGELSHGHDHLRNRKYKKQYAKLTKQQTIKHYHFSTRPYAYTKYLYTFTVPIECCYMGTKTRLVVFDIFSVNSKLLIEMDYIVLA